MVSVAALAIAFLNPSRDFYLDSPRITVSFRVDPAIFPREWQTLEIDPCADRLPSTDEDTCVAALQAELNHYPARMIESNLKNVFIGQRFTFYGLQYGGTNSSDSLYLALPNWHDRNQAFRFLGRAFHHEFSSILLRNQSSKFPYADWQKALPVGFAYRGDGTQALREGTSSTRYEAAYNERGFLAEYSTSSLEEDFNLYAEAILSGDAAFWKLYENYPSVAAKADLVITFYASLDPLLNAKSLRDLAQGPTR